MTLDSLPVGMVQEKARVLLHRRVAPDHFLMRLKSSAASRRAQPGQFIHLLCRGNGEYVPLLRRPISLFDADPAQGAIEFIYKVVGLGTRVLSRVAAGSWVDFLGPLGRPFELPGERRVCILVGGGVGIPPLYLLAKRLLGERQQVIALLGARTKGWVIGVREFQRLGVAVYVATDDGSAGHRGSVVELLGSVIASTFPLVSLGVSAGSAKQSPRQIASVPPRLRYAVPRNDRGILYVCGPTPMMAGAAALARRRGMGAQVSLEERMGCAMGCCMGCAVEVTTEPVRSHARFQRVCTEGPVFPAEKILWK